MTGVRRFEDLVAWQKARILTREIYLHTRQGPFAGDLGLTSQIRHEAVSMEILSVPLDREGILYGNPRSG